MHALRPYQEEAIKALWRFWKETPEGKPLILAPTGSGKSIIIAEICKRVLEQRPTYKIIVLSHRKEIIAQNAEALSKLINKPIGIYSAGLNQKTIRSVTCANIQSIYKKKVDAQLIICDECHLVGQNSDSMYQKFLSQSNAKVVGFTATSMRLDSGSLIGPDKTFSHICYDISIQALIEQGYLSKLISKRTEQVVDFSEVRKSGYDYNQEALEAKMLPLVERHAQEILRRTADRKKILVFCSGVAHAKQVSEALGDRADYVTGEMVNFVRQAKLTNFMQGNTRYLCNCEILTTGFNYPDIDCIVLLRATQSAALYIQAVGRGSRIAPHKSNCLILDFGSNIDRHGPIDCITIRNKDGSSKVKTDKMPIKECAKCGALVAIRTRICPECATEFPASSCLEIKPSEKQIISSAEIFEVQKITWTKHHKQGSVPCLRIKYSNKLQEISDFLCFEHGGYAMHRACDKWRLMRGSLPYPRNTDEALARMYELRLPAQLEVVQEGKFMRILKHRGEFKPDEEQLF